MQKSTNTSLALLALAVCININPVKNLINFSNKMNEATTLQQRAAYDLKYKRPLDMRLK